MDVLVHPSAVTRAARGRLKLIVVFCVVSLIAVGLLTARVTAEARLQAWMDTCVAGGGAVRVDEANGFNPLVAESKEPTYACRSASGDLLSRWR